MKHDRLSNRATISLVQSALSRFLLLTSSALVGVTALPVSASSPPPGPTLEIPSEDISSPATSEFRIQPVEGKIKVRVINEARLPILYGFLGERQQLTLKRGEAVTLDELPVPTTLTFYPEASKARQYIQIRPTITSEPGVMEVKLIETRDLNANRHALVIHQTGLFFTE
jgi:hypothetical protein